VEGCKTQDLELYYNTTAVNPGGILYLCKMDLFKQDEMKCVVIGIHVQLYRCSGEYLACMLQVKMKVRLK